MNSNLKKTHRQIKRTYSAEDGVLLLDKAYFPDSNRIRPHHIEQLIPFLQELPNLTCLGFLYQNLGNKAVQALAPLADLSSLKMLLLPGNVITDKAAPTLAAFHHLTSLDLANNSIGSSGVQYLSSLTNLKQLILDGSMVTDHEAKYIARLKNLEILSLNNSFLGNKGFHALKNLTSLKNLELGSGNISEKELFLLTEMPKLTKLTLGRLKISDKGAKIISSMRNLTDLSLNHNLIGDEGAFALSTLPKLNKLYLSHNQLGNKGLITLAQLPNLAVLDLSHNAPNENILQRFSQALSPRSHQKTAPLSLSSFLKPVTDKKLRLRIAEYAPHLGTLDLSNLEMDDNEFIDLFPTIKSLENLTSLNLSNNHIYGHSALLLGQLTNLVHLNLSRNTIYSNTSFLQKLTQLESLDLSSCLIGIDNKDDFCNLSQLKKLKLTGYDLDNSFVRIIGQLTKLEYLDLTGSSIGNKGAQSISSLTKLKKLFLDDNLIGDAGLYHLLKLKELEILTIYNSPYKHDHKQQNCITSKGAQAISQLKKLTYLKLSSHNFGDKGLLFLATIPHLQHLELNTAPYSGNRITSGWEALGRSKSLRTLKLREHDIDDEGVFALSQNTELTKLDLNDNKVSEEGAKRLLNLKKLRFLDLTKSEIGAEIAARLSSQTELHPIEQARKRIDQYDPSKGTLNLSELNLGNCFLGALIVELSQLEHLTSLILDFNYTGDEGIQYLPALTTLTRLSIQGPGYNSWRLDLGEKIHHAAILASLPNLVFLDLTGNDIRDLSILQQKLPQSCKLLYSEYIPRAP